MIVVSNTSPLTNLAAIGRFSLLERLYEQVYIPEGVWEELNAFGRPWPGSNEVAEASWVELHQVDNRDLITILRRDLDRGEAETVALAFQLNADLVLLDERDGRRAAKRLGLKVVGVVGLLVRAKHKALITSLQSELDALR